MDAYVPPSLSPYNPITKGVVIGEPTEKQIKWTFIVNDHHLNHDLIKVKHNILQTDP